MQLSLPMVEMAEQLKAADYDIIEVPDNGWSFWLSISEAVAAHRAKRQPTFVGNVNNPEVEKETLIAAQAFAEDIAQFIREDPKGEPYRKTIQSLIDQNRLTDRNKTEIKTIDDYLDGISKAFKEIEETNTTTTLLKSGPAVLSDITIFLPAIVEEGSRNVSVTVFAPMADDPSTYNALLPHKSSNPGALQLNLLRVGSDQYNILKQKAGGAGQEAPAAAGAAAAAENKPGAAKRAMTNARARQLEGRKPSRLEKFGARAKGAFAAARGRLSAKSIKEAAAKLGPAIRAGKKKLLQGSMKGEVIVAGERVRVEEAGFSPARFYDVVSLKDKYFPNRKSEEEMESAKRVFREVFADATEVTNIDNPLPPCDSVTREILLEGLKNRFETLRQDILALYESEEDVGRVRAMLDHIQRLKIYIDHLERKAQEGSCFDYDAEGKKEGAVDIQFDDEIRNLLRQFVFMILQARMPVSEFDDATEEARRFIQQLKGNPISEEEMNAYIVLWREQAALLDKPEKMPQVIAEILEGTATQRGILDMMLQDELNALLNEIIRAVQEDYAVIKDTEISDGFTRLLEGFAAEPTKPVREKVVEVVKYVMSSNKRAWEKMQEVQAAKGASDLDLERLRAELQKCQSRYRVCVEENERLEGKITELNNKGIDLEGKVASGAAERAGLAAQHAAALEAAATKLAEAERVLNATQEELRAATGKNSQLGEALADAQAAAAAAAAARAAAEENLVTAQAVAAASATRVAALEAQLAAADKARADAEAAKALADAQVAALQAQQAAIMEGTTTSDQERARLRSEIARMEIAIAAAQREAATQKAAAEAAAARAAECGAALAAAEAATGEAAARAMTAEEAKARDVADAQALTANKQGVIDSQATKIDELTRQIEAAKAATATAHQNLADARVTVAIKEGEIARLRAQVETGNTELAGQLAAATRALDTARARVGELEGAATAAAATHDAAIAAKDTKIADLERKAEEARRNLEECQRAAAEAERRHTEALREEQDRNAAAAAEAAAGNKGLAESHLQQLAAVRAGLEAANEEKRRCNEQLAAARGRLIEAEAAAAAAAAAAVNAGDAEKLREERAKLLSIMGRLAAGVITEAGIESAIAESRRGEENQLTNSFAAVLNRISAMERSAKQAGIAEGQAQRPENKYNTSTQVCFLSYFVTFFIKTLFFSKDNRPEKKSLLDTIDAFITSLIGAYKNSSAAANQENDTTILYKFLATVFGLLYAGETLFVNKQAMTGVAPPLVGLQALKLADPGGERAKLVKLLCETWDAASQEEGVRAKVNLATHNTFSNLLLNLPLVHFHPPMEVNEGVVPELLVPLHQFPLLTFLPAQEDAGKAEVQGRFHVVDIENNFTTTTVQTSSVLRGPAKTVWDSAVRLLTKFDHRLSYKALFCIFIVLGRRYLVTMQDVMQREFKCPLPAILRDPGVADQGLVQEAAGTFTKLKEASDRRKAEAAAAAEAARLAEEERRRREVAEAAEAARRAAEAAEAARRAAEAAAEEERRRRAAEAAAATPVPQGYSLDRPKLGEGFQTNSETLYNITSVLAKGSRVTLPRLFKVDFDIFGSTSAGYPLRKFFDEYLSAYETWKRFTKPTDKSPPDSFENTNILNMMTFINNLDKAPKTRTFKPGEAYGNINYLRKFFCFLLYAYAQQYNIENAPTFIDKIKAVYTELVNNFNMPITVIHRNGPENTDLFKRIGFTEEYVDRFIANMGGDGVHPFETTTLLATVELDPAESEKLIYRDIPEKKPPKGQFGRGGGESAENTDTEEEDGEEEMLE